MKYFTKNRINNFDATTAISLSDIKNGLDYWEALNYE
jgi:hypothetical protein